MATKKDKRECVLLAFVQKIAKMEQGCAPSVGYMSDIIQAARKAIEEYKQASEGD